jgi:two-component system OmpR family sensor kinase
LISIKELFRHRSTNKNGVQPAKPLHDSVHGAEEGHGPPEIEDRSKLEAASGRNKIKIDLLVHDLKVPLAVIEAGVSTLLNRREKYGPLTEKQEKVLVRALRNTKITQALVNDALELGRSRAGVINASHFKVSYWVEQSLMEIFDLVDFGISEDIKQYSDLAGLKGALREKGIALVVDEDLWCEEVCLDEPKMRQIFRNLLSNALKYRKDRVEVHVEKRGDHLTLSVKDDGEGIPAAFHNRIFECYFQLDSVDSCPVRGHGLGLAGVLVLVEDLGGRLLLESDAGRGATFSVELPFILDRQGQGRR